MFSIIARAFIPHGALHCFNLSMFCSYEGLCSSNWVVCKLTAIFRGRLQRELCELLTGLFGPIEGLERALKVF